MQLAIPVFLLFTLLLCVGVSRMEAWGYIRMQVVQPRCLLALAIGLAIVAFAYSNVDPDAVLRRSHGLRMLVFILGPVAAVGGIAFPEFVSGSVSTTRRI